MSTATPTTELDQPDVKSAIGEIFGERAALAIQYSDLLRTAGIERGLLGPREADRVWHRHILNSAVLATLIPTGVRVIDLGSGAGLPGIPLAIARPDLTMVLLEPMQRRLRFLRDCIIALDLPGVQIVPGRAEDGMAALADYVVARAIAPLDKLVRLSFGLLADNGVLLALKGAGAAGEIEGVRREMGIDAELMTLAAPGQPATVVRVTRPPRSQPTRRQQARSRQTHPRQAASQPTDSPPTQERSR